MPKLRIELNGTDVNPYEKLWGLKQNPFPQLGSYETDAAERCLDKLGGPPIPHDRAAEYIRETLTPYFTESFIKYCIANFRPGEVVRLCIEWEE